MARITLEIPDDLERDLTSIAAKRGETRDEMIFRSLRGLRFSEELRERQREFAPIAQAMGIKSDQDIFDMMYEDKMRRRRERACGGEPLA